MTLHFSQTTLVLKAAPKLPRVSRFSGFGFRGLGFKVYRMILSLEDGAYLAKTAAFGVIPYSYVQVELCSRSRPKTQSPNPKHQALNAKVLCLIEYKQCRALIE